MAMNVLLRLLECVAILLVVPMGLAALPGPPRWATTGWRWSAPPAALALVLRPGPVVAAVVAPWVLLTVALAVLGAARGTVALRAAGRQAWPTALTWFALAGPAVAGTAHLAERAGIRLFGFGPRTLALTVAHLQVAGFAAVLLCAWAATAAAGHPVAGLRRAGAAAAVLLPLGVLVVLVGYFVADLVELAGAVLVTAGLWAACAVLWFAVRPSASDRWTRTLLAVTALVPLPTMLLALAWAGGEATGTPHPSLTWMLATHGLGNAFGVALCGLLGHRLLGRRPLGDRTPGQASPATAPALATDGHR
jgi:hypothetical protein